MSRLMRDVSPGTHVLNPDTPLRSIPVASYPARYLFIPYLGILRDSLRWSGTRAAVSSRLRCRVALALCDPDTADRRRTPFSTSTTPVSRTVWAFPSIGVRIPPLRTEAADSPPRQGITLDSRYGATDRDPETLEQVSMNAFPRLAPSYTLAPDVARLGSRYDASISWRRPETSSFGPRSTTLPRSRTYT
jgi:hypothetical protein